MGLPVGDVATCITEPSMSLVWSSNVKLSLGSRFRISRQLGHWQFILLFVSKLVDWVAHDTDFMKFFKNWRVV
jgi:hypothetical protein